MPLDIIKIVLISLTGIINVSLGFLVLIRNPKNNVNKSFCLISVLYGIWAFCLLFYEFPLIFSSVFWIKATYLAISVNEVFILIFSFLFPKPAFKKAWIFGGLYSVFFLSLTIYLLFFTNIWVVGVIIDPVKGLHTILGSSYIWWSLSIWGELFFAITIFLLNIKNSHGSNRAQIIFLLSGFSLFGIVATISDIILPLFYNNTSLFAISTTASLIFTFTATYVIIKHKFLDIRLIAARTVAYSLLITVISIFYVGAAFLISSFLLGVTTQLNQLLIYMVLSVVVALSFEKLRIFFENITDKIFFKGHYDSNQLLSDLGHIMSSTIDLHSLTSSILKTMVEEIKITRGIFVLVDGENLYSITTQGFAANPTLTYFQILPLLSRENIVVFDELEEGELKQLMRVINISISTVLKVKDVIIGLLLFGEKSSGETYTDQDLKLINILGPEIAVAIQNAQSFDKIKKFNITLTQEVKIATDDLQKANVKLKTLDKLKDDFVSVASHELRTPMTAIRSYVWMVLNRPDVTLTEKMKKYLSRTLISTERLINLVNDMLNVSRIEAGSIEIRPKSFDIRALADEVMVEVGSKASEKSLHLEIEQGSPLNIFADPDKVHQILLNLVGNSLKFTPTEGKINIGFFPDGKMVDISVKDSGVGISQDDQSRLFKKFERLENSYVSSATSGGTGLGLFISKSLVELMGGKIWASSEGAGRGSTFTFSLPLSTLEVLSQAEKYTKKPSCDIKILEPVVI